MHTDNPITITVGTNIAKARKAQGYSQKRLAELIEHSETAIRFWESGRREIGHDALLQVGRVLGRPWLWFYQDHEEELAPPTPIVTGMNAVTLASFRSLISDEERMIYDAIRMKAEAKAPLSEREARFQEEIQSRILAASGGGLSFCPPAQLSDGDEEKTVISAALVARAAFLQEQRKAG